MHLKLIRHRPCPIQESRLILPNRFPRFTLTERRNPVFFKRLLASKVQLSHAVEAGELTAWGQKDGLLRINVATCVDERRERYVGWESGAKGAKDQRDV